MGTNPLFCIRCDTSPPRRRRTGDQEVIRLARQNVFDAQEISQDDNLRFSPEGWARFETLMAQAEVSFGTF